MLKTLHLVFAGFALLAVAMFGALRVVEWREARELMRERDEFLAADQVRAALKEYTGAQFGRIEDFTCVHDVVRGLRAEGRLSAETADYIEQHRARFVWESHKGNFDVVWLVAASSER